MVQLIFMFLVAALASSSVSGKLMTVKFSILSSALLFWSHHISALRPPYISSATWFERPLALRKTAKIKAGQIIECEGKRILISIDPNAEIKPPKVKAPKVKGKGQPNRRSGSGPKTGQTKAAKKAKESTEKKSPWH